MIIVIGVMFVTSLLLVATFTAANGEIHLSSDRHRAEEGLLRGVGGDRGLRVPPHRGRQLPELLHRPPPSPTRLNQVGCNGESRRRSRVRPNRRIQLDEEYAIQLLPAESDTRQRPQLRPQPARRNDDRREVGSSPGTFRIESTGYSGSQRNARSSRLPQRQLRQLRVVHEVRNRRPGHLRRTSDRRHASQLLHRMRQVLRGTARRRSDHPTALHQQLLHQRRIGQRPDAHRGPRRRLRLARLRPQRRRPHRIRACGSGGDEGYSGEGVCAEASNPVFKGNTYPPKEVVSIEPPPGDEELKHIVEPAYVFKNKTEIVLEDSTMTLIKLGRKCDHENLVTKTQVWCCLSAQRHHLCCRRLLKSLFAIWAQAKVHRR